MDENKKAELIQRTFGLKHKLKVLESMKTPETHEEKTSATIARWELEDELKAIEELLEESRSKNRDHKKDVLLSGGVGAIKKLRSQKQASKASQNPGLKTQKKSTAKRKKAASKK